MKYLASVLWMVFTVRQVLAWEETSPRSPSPPVTLTKPATLGALDWLQQLENDRDEAELTANRVMLDAIAAETKATLGGKYGLSNRQATPQERVIMIASIQRNCRIAPYAIGSLEDYLGYVPEEGRALRLQADPVLSSHLGAILAIVAITHMSLQSTEVADTWIASSQGSTPLPSDLFPLLRKEASRHCSTPLWATLEKLFTATFTHPDSLLLSACEGFQYVPPRLHLQEVIDDLLADGKDYKGWEVHGLSSLGRWPDISGQSTGQALHAIYKACERRGGHWEPLLSRALCLTPETMRCFSYLDDAFYDGKTWAVELMFTYNLEGQTPAIVNLVLTRKGSLGNTNLSKELDFKAKQEAYWSSLAYRPSLFTRVDEFTIFVNAYSFDFTGGGYDMKTLVERGAISVPVGSLRQYLAQSGFKGHPEALYALATLWEEGKDGLPDSHIARLLYERSADLGYAPAQRKLGILVGPSSIHFDGELVSFEESLQAPSLAPHRQALNQFFTGGPLDSESFMDALAALSQHLPALPRHFHIGPVNLFHL